KARAEVEGMIAAERKAREEAEKRAQAEIANRIESEKKARAEAERQTEIARKAREEAEAKARELASSGNAQAAQKARADAEAIAKKAEEAVAQARAMAESEKKARAEAEERAKAEAVARVMQEQQLRAKSEDEIKARVQEEIKARELAEMEAEARYRQEAAARAKTAAEERRKREEEGRGAAPVARVKQPTNWAKTAVVGVLALLAGAVGLLEVVPLNNFIDGAQDIMSKRLGMPVKISGLRYKLASGPGLTLERVAIGKLQEIKVESITIGGMPTAFLGAAKSFDNVDIAGISADQDSLALVPGWLKPQAGDQSLRLKRIKLSGVRLTTRGIEVPIFGGDVVLAPDGGLERAVLTDGKFKVDLAAKDKGLRVGVEARSWKLPIGPALEFDDLALEANVEQQQATLTGIEGHIAGTTIKGAGKAGWGPSGIKVDGEFSVTNGDLSKLLATFTGDFTANGLLTTNGTYSIAGPSLEKLFTDSKVEATFNVERGALNNVDVVRAIQSPSRDGVRGGRTSFNSLTGSMQLASKVYSFRQLQLASGPMQANGTVDIAANGDLSGRVSAELGTKTMVVAKGTVSVTGNIKTPILKP
ncbi:MAG TPA: AsmA-like C-terminal region-containing protein, partial [Burkholderiales bacterium]